MVIDMHAHVLRKPLIRFHPDVTPFMSAEQQLQVMDRLQIDKAVILPLFSPEVLPESQSPHEVLQICADYPGRFIPFCNVDPRITSTAHECDSDYFVFLLQQFAELGFCGLGELTAKILWDDPRLIALLTACGQVNFPVVFHTSLIQNRDYGPMDDLGFPRLENVLRSIPEVRLIGHSMAFWSEISGDVVAAEKSIYPQGTVRPGGRVIELLEKYPNLYADLSANSGYNALARDPEFAHGFIERFQRQLLMGLDYCSPKNERPLIDWLYDAVNNGKISQTAYNRIMGDNAFELLGLADETSAGFAAN
jgi:predicted TIM-barrel fold metal-dependent hydrolase